MQPLLQQALLEVPLLVGVEVLVVEAHQVIAKA
jgi:hypothetical protein